MDQYQKARLQKLQRFVGSAGLDAMLVTKNGFERLTKYPDDLQSLIVRDKRTIKKIKGLIVRKAVNLDRF